MARSGEVKALRFRAGEVGFVFYEDSVMPGLTAGRTYAFGTIGDAAAWLIEQFPTASRENQSSTVVG